jgi:hypothetical protein
MAKQVNIDTIVNSTQFSLCDLMQLPEAPLLHEMQLMQLAYL